MYAVPVGVGIICLTLAALLHFVSGQAPRLVLVLVLVASTSIGGAAAQGVHSAVNSTVTATNQASTAALGGSFTVALTLICAFLVFHALKGKRAGAAVAVHGGGHGHGGGGGRRGGRGVSNTTLAAAAALPWLAAATPGQFGSIMVAILSALTRVVGGFGHLLGL